MNYFELLGRYTHAMCAADSLEGRFAVYGNYIRQLGFDGATYTFVPRIQWELLPKLPAVFLYTNPYPLGFLEHYERERLDRHDFTIRRVLSGETAPMDWREHELSGQLSADEVGLIRLAKEKYGILNALSIPLLEERGAAGMSVISFKEDTEFYALKQEALALLLNFTYLFHHLVFADSLRQFVSPIVQSLSEKEREVLVYKSRGKVIKNINFDLGIDDGYANNLFSSMKKRLGNVRTERLLYLFGLLNALPELDLKDKEM